ncbi:MAG TPA: hypothetical protein VFP60_11790 [Pseudolabrys sp.]|nr:hypothetical protein [Pseudolabrys sp.]
MKDYLIGTVLLAIGLLLIVIARPNKSGQHPFFLRFEQSSVLYPPIVMVFLVTGAAELITAFLGITR